MEAVAVQRRFLVARIFYGKRMTKKAKNSRFELLF
jgi:hypothetical protein